MAAELAAAVPTVPTWTEPGTAASAVWAVAVPAIRTDIAIAATRTAVRRRAPLDRWVAPTRAWAVCSVDSMEERWSAVVSMIIAAPRFGGLADPVGSHGFASPPCDGFAVVVHVLADRCIGPNEAGL